MLSQMLFLFKANKFDFSLDNKLFIKNTMKYFEIHFQKNTMDLH